MLSEICAYLRNYFDRDMPKYYGKFKVSGSGVKFSDGADLGIKGGQFYRIMGSTFNDGVWQHQEDDDELISETFDGAVWLMAVPYDVRQLAEEISEWNKKYATIDSAAMSPFSSESFGGYSYSKGSSTSDGGGSGSPSWITAFASRLRRYKKI